MSKYGFSGGGIELPHTTPDDPARRKVDPLNLTQAVQAGNELGFVSREPVQRIKPGPKRREPQDKVSIPGPKRVTDAFRAFCQERGLTLWEGLEILLKDREGSG
jgi:hypothetical protein